MERRSSKVAGGAWILPVVVLLAAPAPAGESVADAAALQAAVARAAAAVADSVVMIETLGGLSPKADDPMDETGPGEAKPGKRKPGSIFPRGFPQAAGPATGVVVSPDGYVLTSSFHFLRKPTHVFVTLPGGDQRVATLLGQDHTRGLALLKVEAEGLTVPAFAPRESLRVGRFVAALGRGYGYERPSMHLGILSALNRIHGKAVQTDAKTSPVNYGGPLVDLEGRVVGVIAPLSMQGEYAGVDLYDSGIGFAVPADDLPAVVERLKKGLEIHPAFLGIRPDPRHASGGVRVAEVVPGTAAEEAGLKEGDVIVGLDGKAVGSFLEFFSVLGRLEAGDRVALEIENGSGERRRIEVVLGKRE